MKKQFPHYFFKLLLFLFIISSGYSQQGTITNSAVNVAQNGRPILLDDLFRKLKNTDLRKQVKLENIEGSPYFNNTFSQGEIFYRDRMLGNAYLRYDAFNDEIQIKKTNKKEEIFNALLKDKYLEAKFDDKNYTYTAFKNKKGEINEGYLLNVVNNGRFKLLKRKTKKFQQGKTAPNSLLIPLSAKFITITKYYLDSESNEFIMEIKKTKKGLLEMFEENDRIKIKDIIKDKKLNISNDNDLISLFYLLNANNA